MALWKQSIVKKASQRKDISRLRKKRECGSDTFLLKADRGEGEQCSCAPQYLTLQYLKYLNICNIWDCNKNSITWELYISVWWCWWWMFLKEKKLRKYQRKYIQVSKLNLQENSLSNSEIDFVSSQLVVGALSNGNRDSVREIAGIPQLTK